MVVKAKASVKPTPRELANAPATGAIPPQVQDPTWDPVLCAPLDTGEAYLCVRSIIQYTFCCNSVVCARPRGVCTERVENFCRREEVSNVPGSCVGPCRGSTASHFYSHGSLRARVFWLVICFCFLYGLYDPHIHIVPVVVFVPRRIYHYLIRRFQ